MTTVMMKKPTQLHLKTVIFITLIILFIFTQCRRESEEEYLAIVGEESITIDEMDTRLEMLFGSETLIDGEVIKIVLDDLIERQLVINKGRQLGLSIDDEELNSYIKTVYPEKTPTDYQKMMAREDLLIAKVLEKEVAGGIASTFVNEKLSIDTGEQGDYVVFYEITTESEESINEVKAKLQTDVDFDMICREYSCTPSSSEGGRVGPVELNTLPVEFINVLNTLTEDQYSEPFKTEYGYHIIKLLSRLSPEQYMDNFYSIEHMKQSFSEKYKEWLDTLRKDSYIKVNEDTLNSYIENYAKRHS